MTRKRKIPSSSNCKWYNCGINTFETTVKAKQSSAQLVANFSKKQRKFIVFALYEFEKIKNDGYFYFSKNINYTWLKRGTFKLSQDQNDMFIRYLVPEIERLEYESLSKVVYKTTVLSRCFEQVLWMKS